MEKDMKVITDEENEFVLEVIHKHKCKCCCFYG